MPLWSLRAGHRTSVAEQSGRTVNYSYDDLYRLTNETIASDPSGINGAVNYTYDPVGNRKQMTSTLPGVVAGLFNYDANDRFTAGDTYDANGNTIASGGIGNAYDFENHLVQKGGVTIVYDGDGNRVAKTTASGTTLYLVDTLNPTGYTQVIAEEAPNTAPLVPYVYGLERISQRRTVVINGNFTTQIRYFDYDGHGSVRGLTDPSGNVTDTYDYDAFGNLIHQTGTTQNVYLYSGEQFDPDLNLYYNRARYLNVSTGRFWTMDSEDGCECDPISLHRYLYVSADPANYTDPSGHEEIGIVGVSVSVSVSEQLDSVDSRVEQVAGQKAKRIFLCQAGKFIVDQAITQGVYIFLQEIAPGILVPYVGQSGDIAARIAQHVRDEKIFEPVLSFIEVAGGQEARRIVEQKIINVLTNGGLRAGVRSLPSAERLIANLRNEIR